MAKKYLHSMRGRGAVLAYRNRLHAVHVMRLQSRWGKNYDVSKAPWPKTEADWRQIPHGAPWDFNVEAAEWHLSFANELLLCGLIGGEG